MKHWQPAGTVYGCLLNFQREWDLWAPRMAQDPHKGPPKAPVLYVKSANTFNPSGTLTLQDGVNEVDIGATLGLVMGAMAHRSARSCSTTGPCRMRAITARPSSSVAAMGIWAADRPRCLGQPWTPPD